MKSLEEIIQSSRASQDKDELSFVYDRVSQIKPKVIVEIGSWRGHLLETFSELFAPELLIGVESDPSVIDPLMLSRFTIIQGASDDSGTFDKLCDLLGNRKIDYLFIDADHTYQAVKKDFEIYSPLVRKGGIIGFHDVALEGLNADGHAWWNLGLQVKKFWDEIRQEYRHEEKRGSTLSTGTGLLYIDE